MRLCSIASGSSGNCIYAGSSNTHILIDAGISKKKIDTGLKELELKSDELQGILITHEHIDHVKGLGVMARKNNIPMYATKETIEEILCNKSLGDMDSELFRTIEPDKDFVIGDLTIHPFKISHDAANPVAYVIEENQKKVGILTDLGKYDKYIVDNIRGMDVLLLEANHDINMLQVGPYPYYLKQRILGDMGHLSNENAGRLLSEVLHDGFKKVILGHVSKENNFPQLAYETVRLEIKMGDNPYKENDFPIHVAAADALSDVINI